MKIAKGLLETKSAEELCSPIQSLLEQEIKNFEDQLIGDISHIHPQAEPCSPIKISSISYKAPGVYKMHYTFEWQTSGTCSDLHLSDTHSEIISVKLEADGSLILGTVDHGSRSTADEL